MKIALVNPPWTFDGSIFSCREPHLPLEYGYAKALLESAGHEAAIFDAHFFRFSMEELRRQIAAYCPDLTSVATAPSHFSRRYPPPDLNIPRQTVEALREVAGKVVAVGPHGSTNPRTTIEKLGVDVVVLGECEEVLVELAGRPSFEWSAIEGIAHAEAGRIVGRGAPRASRIARLPPLRWGQRWLLAHHHHHHRFESDPEGPGAEVETSRGYPDRHEFYSAESRRDSYRKRNLRTTLDEIDGLILEGVQYVYFVDEVFLPDRRLLEALGARGLSFGAQLRIGDWEEDMLDLLGRAGCVSIEATVEDPSETELLLHAKRSIACVRANLLDLDDDRPFHLETRLPSVRAHAEQARP